MYKRRILIRMHNVGTKLLLLVFCIFFLVDAEAKRKTEPAPLEVNQKEIQEGVMSLADSWLSLVSEGYQSFETQVETPELRLSAKKMRFGAMASAVEIATIPYAGRALLDMMVLSSLSRTIWERHWLATYGAPAQQLADTFTVVENEIWQFASRFATPEQLEELHKLIDQWLADHPDALAANFVRFSDFGSLRGAPALIAATKPGGWLSTARSAAAAAEGIQELSERAMFLAVRMQELMASRLDLSVAETLATPEINQLLDDVSGFRKIAEEYAVLIEKLPADVTQEIDALISSSLLKISAEREAMIVQMMSEISLERQAAIEQLMESVGQERSAALRQTLDGLQSESDAVLSSIATIVIWSNLQAKALFNRVFVLAVCLFLLYFLLRLVYRYMRDRETFTFRHVMETIVLLAITSVPIIIIGVLFVEYTEPDMAEIEKIGSQMRAAEAELSKGETRK